MKINKSIFSWMLSLWLCCTLVVQSSHGIDLLIQEVSHNHSEEHHHKDGSLHHDEDCSICHFHISPSVLPHFTSLGFFEVNEVHVDNIFYRERTSEHSKIFTSLRGPPYLS